MITDTNVYLARWPFRRLPDDETAALVARMKERGVTQAWCGSFDALLHDDVGSVNARLAAECKASGGLLIPAGAINLRIPDWEEELRRCHEVHGMRIMRLHPNYQGYTLAHADTPHLLEQAARRRMIVQIAVQMEDERTQHPAMRVAPVDLAPLVSIVPRISNLRLQILNLRALPPLFARLPGVLLDLGMHEGALGLRRLLTTIPADRVLFGTCAPLFYWESTHLKIREAGLSEAAARQILHHNAQRTLGEAAR